MTEADHLAKATSAVQTPYLRYKQFTMALGDDVSFRPTEERYIGFWANGGRFIALGIRQQHFKIWFRVEPGTLRDPECLTRQTEVGHTVQIRDDQHFAYIVGLIEQAYRLRQHPSQA